MAIESISRENFEEKVLRSSELVLADFNADWCGPCRLLHRVLEEVAEERPNLRIASINVDDNPELAAQYGIASIPCLIVFQNGAEVKRSVGYQPKDALLDLIGD